jgi:hypothetical protein
VAGDDRKQGIPSLADRPIDHVQIDDETRLRIGDLRQTGPGGFVLDFELEEHELSPDGADVLPFESTKRARRRP